MSFVLRLADSPAAASSEPAAKRQRAGLECVAELKELEELLDCGVLLQSEFLDLKRRVLRAIEKAEANVELGARKKARL